MIQESEVMPFILGKCPAFLPTWEKHRHWWGAEEAGIYNDLAEFAQFIVDAYAREENEPVVAAFEIIEELLDHGNDEVRTAAAIGFLEDVRNIASHRPFGSDVFRQRLGPKSRTAWAEIEETWRGKASLADVVRAEQAPKKRLTS